MKRFVTVVAVGMSLVLAGGVAAQEPAGSVINADGSSGASRSGSNPAVDADGPTIVYGDVTTGPGNTVIGPPLAPLAPGTSGNISANDGAASALGPGSAEAAPGTVTGGVSGTALLGPDGTYNVTDSPPSNVTTGGTGSLPPAPEPVIDTTVSEPVDTGAVETAIGVEGDADGDNYADALELEIGLDPNNVDSDGDGVADGDEINIYLTDPFVWDTDGDGVSDGDELFNTRTDPLVWADTSGAATDGGAETAEVVETVDSGAAATSDDSDGDRLADVDEAALGTDPTVADTDGDGYYDGDEANLSTDPFDPGSFPEA